ncbi:MAG: peptide chain release factor N(5)-glutamine methyltransferase [Candidatus Aadella gelida]|nr:peptide chain release factor N(5)-glutamine methyltransferase [Candidatus Aadella gelida]
MKTETKSDSIPMQYREGKTAFMGMDIKVDERVLIPRPETELLVEVAGDILKQIHRDNVYIAEVGTGSGAVAIALAKLIDNANIVAADISRDALVIAAENVDRFDKNGQIKLVHSDVFSFFSQDFCGKFDAIVSNPPYVSENDYGALDEWVLAEPKTALYGGPEGMDILKKIISESMELLSPGGFVALEIGYDQSEKVKKELRANDFIEIKSFKDFNGHERVIVGRKSG